jgi:RNA polymerase sigma-70 factor (ECF subfamily)
LREVLLLRGVEEMSQAETAALLDVSEKTVETRLYRARAKLRQLLAGKGDDRRY